jgi:hypothetical protein
MRLRETQQRLANCQAEVTRLEGDYQARGRPERPYSRLAQARRRLNVQQRRLPRRQEPVARAQRRVEQQRQRVEGLHAKQTALQQRLACFEADNATNRFPVQVLFHLDGGFGTGENVTPLIEMGYEVYTKPYSHHVSATLQDWIGADTLWEPVGANAETSAFTYS